MHDNLSILIESVRFFKDFFLSLSSPIDLETCHHREFIRLGLKILLKVQKNEIFGKKLVKAIELKGNYSMQIMFFAAGK